MNIIEVTDLPAAMQSEESIYLMVAGANARAARVAPCLTWDGSVVGEPSPTNGQRDEARLILLGAIQRWVQAGAGALSSQQAGPFAMAVDTRQRTGYNLWPSEIEGLQGICATGSSARRAFDVDGVSASSAHLAWCSLAFGALYCSCGVDIAGEPIYELD